MTFNESCKFLSRVLLGNRINDYLYPFKTGEQKVKKSKKTNNKKKET